MSRKNKKQRRTSEQYNKPLRGVFITQRAYLSLVRKIAILEERLTLKSADFETLVTMYQEQDELLSQIENTL